MDRRAGRWRPRVPEVALAVVLALAGAAAFVAYRMGARSAPRSSADTYLVALGRADLENARSVSTPECHRDLLRTLCRPRHARIVEVYEEVIPRLALPRWRTHRRTAERLAEGEYWRLRALVVENGTLAIGELSEDQMMALTSDAALHGQFVYCEGVGRLSPTDRDVVGDPETFRVHQGGDSFIGRAAWDVLEAAAREELGGPLALSSEMTTERLAFYDKVAWPMLAPQSQRVPGEHAPREGGYRLDEECRITAAGPTEAPASRTVTTPDLQAVIQGVPREDARTLDVFVERHGEETVRQVLESAAIGAPAISDVAFVALARGRLFRGPDAAVTAKLPIAERREPVTLALARPDGAWAVTAVPDELGRTAE